MYRKKKVKRFAALILSGALALTSMSVVTFAEEATMTNLPTEEAISVETPETDEATPSEGTPTSTPETTQQPTDEPISSAEPISEPSAEPDVEPSTEPSAEPTTEPPVPEETEVPPDIQPTIQQIVENKGYAYVATIKQGHVYSNADCSADSLLFTTNTGNQILLATAWDASDNVRVCFLDDAQALVSGFIAASELLEQAVSEEYLLTLDGLVVPNAATDIGQMPLCIVSGEYAQASTEAPLETPAPDEQESSAAVSDVGDFLSVTTNTRVFYEVDDYATEETYTSAFLGYFVQDAIVQVTDVLQDSFGNAWYQVSYLYGADAAHGGTTWTETDTVYVLADETEATDNTECTVTDYAYSKEFLQLIQQTDLMFSTTAMSGFSLKNISVNLGGFYEWQSNLYGSSGKDSAYPQIAKSAAHGTIYATPHYLEGYTVFCLEHNENGPGEDNGPTGPYVLVDMDTFANDASAGGATGVRFSARTMHAIGWVLRHTYPFMALDRSDSNNLVWSRVAGQFAIREVIKQLEGAQYVRDYWDMDNFYAFSGGAPSVYLTYARWLATNGIARASISGKITLSNKSTSISGSSYIGSVTVTTDADLIRIPLSVGSLSGYSGGSDGSYYYARSGDTLRLTSSKSKFSLSMESISSDSEEANFLVGVPSVALQKVLVPTYGHPYPLQSTSVTFELSQGAITVTKKSTDGKFLTGTVFELLNASGTVISTAATSANGTASFTALAPGSYTVREKTPSQGYKLAATTTQNVTVTAGVTGTVNFVNERIYGKVRIVKTDSQTGKPLAGATFTVTRLSCPASDNAADVGKVVATITTNEAGIAETGSLPWGQYRIQETGVPSGYLDAGYSVTTWIQ